MVRINEFDYSSWLNIILQWISSHYKAGDNYSVNSLNFHIVYTTELPDSNH